MDATSLSSSAWVRRGAEGCVVLLGLGGARIRCTAAIKSAG